MRTLADRLDDIYLTGVCGQCGHKHILGSVICDYNIVVCGSIHSCDCRVYVPFDKVD